MSVIVAPLAHRIYDLDAPAVRLPFLPASVNEAWRSAAAALRRPDETLALGDEEFAALVSLLENQLALPLFVRARGESALWAEAGEERAAALERRCRPYILASALTIKEVGNVVSALVATGLHPVVLKGPALALRFYAAPHLRPFSDLDLLFTDRAEAERAHAVLRAAGYVLQEQPRGGDPWLWSRHLPEVKHPGRLLHVECHGGLAFPPRDRRHARERVLVAELDQLDFGGCRAHVLAPEASVINAFAHAFVRHAGEPLRLTVLLDADAVIRKEGVSFRWERLTGLAAEAGFARATAMGLEACGELLGVSIPDTVAAWCRNVLAGGRVRSRVHGLQRVRSAGHLSGILHADTPGGALSMLFFSTFPTRAFMRWRYPEKARLPLVMLYPYRWAVQGRKAMSLGSALISSVFRHLRPGPKGNH